MEGKVDDVLHLLKSERIGNVLGDRRVLQPLVERARREGKISTTDWSAIADLGSHIAHGIEALRAHIRAQIEAHGGGWRPSERVRDAEGLSERKGFLHESLALLIVAEYNLNMWHELKITNVRQTEPTQQEWTLNAAQAAIKWQLQDDQAIADALHAALDRLTTPSLFDGLAPWQKPELIDARVKLNDLALWFADQRLLEFVPLGQAPYPSFTDSLRQVRRSFEQIAGGPVGTLRLQLRRRDHRPTRPELPPPTPPPS